jgi:hypothetical protein
MTGQCAWWATRSAVEPSRQSPEVAAVADHDQVVAVCFRVSRLTSSTSPSEAA